MKKTIQEITQRQAKYLGDNAQNILISFCEIQKINVGTFLSNNKDNSLVKDKKIVSYIISELTDLNQTQISQLFKYKDHTSVNKYISDVKNKYEKNTKGFCVEYVKILTRLVAYMRSNY